jgi:polyisoprenoid-binding protein YceI
MKKVFFPVLAGFLLVTSAFMSVQTQEWKISTGYSIKFISKDPSGIFKDFKGMIKYDEKDLAGSKFDVSIDVSSISTGNGMMNKKAQIEEWFNSEKYPDIKFVSSKIEKSSDGFSISGSLTIKGTSKEKKIPMKVIKAGNDLTFTGTFPVNRMDFKVGHKSDAVPDIMNITYSIPVTKK